MHDRSASSRSARYVLVAGLGALAAWSFGAQPPTAAAVATEIQSHLDPPGDLSIDERDARQRIGA